MEPYFVSLDFPNLVETTVKDINSKFDSLFALVAGTSRSDGRPVSQPPTHPPAGPAAHSRATSTPRCPFIPMQGITQPLRGLLRPQGLAAPGYDEYVLEHFRREEFCAPRADDSKGFSNDIFTTVLAPKPCMYLNRPGIKDRHR